jgi:Na+/phosphate symporter
MDPTISNGRRRSKDFWSKVHRMYGELLVNQNKHLMEDHLVTRDVASIKNCWSKEEIQKFSLLLIPLYKKAYDERVSGTTNGDILEAAMDMHRDQYNSPFKFKHCLLAELEKIAKLNPKSDYAEVIDIVDGDDDDDDDDEVEELDDDMNLNKKMSATKVKRQRGQQCSLCNAGCKYNY